MASNELVLLKPRAQQLFELVAMPLVYLPIGPAMRAFLGDTYSPLYGFGVGLLMVLVWTRLASLWATRHGGEWMTKEERLRRCVEQAESIPRAWTALATAAMMALTLIGGFLIIAPLDEAAGFFGGGALLAIFIVGASLAGGASALVRRRRLLGSVITAGTPPADHYRSTLRSVALRIWLAFGIGAVVGVIVGSRFPKDQQGAVYMISCIVVGIGTHLALLRRQRPQNLYSGMETTLGRASFAGLILFGVPMAIMFGGSFVMDTLGSPLRMGVGIAISIVAGAIAGPAFGAFMHVATKFMNPRQRGSE